LIIKEEDQKKDQVKIGECLEKYRNKGKSHPPYNTKKRGGRNSFDEIPEILRRRSVTGVVLYQITSKKERPVKRKTAGTGWHKLSKRVTWIEQEKIRRVGLAQQPVRGATP